MNLTLAHTADSHVMPHHRQSLPSFVAPALRLIAVLICGGSIARAEIRPEYLMDRDPQVVVPPPIKKFSPKLAALWMTALARPEVDMQRQTAEAIARGHVAGIPDLIAAAPRLTELLGG